MNHWLKQVQEEKHNRCSKLTFAQYVPNVIFVIEKDMQSWFTQAGQGKFTFATDYEYIRIPFSEGAAVTVQEREHVFLKLHHLTPKEIHQRKIMTLGASSTK